jgi:hypothetical protein
MAVPLSELLRVGDCQATRQQILVNKQIQGYKLQAHMDEASQQILHEYRHAEAKLVSEIISESSTPRTPLEQSHSQPMSSTDSNSSQTESSQQSPINTVQS